MTYEQIGADLGRLVEDKQAAYGNSYGRSGDVMRLLYPDGIRPEQMDDALAVVRVVDKLFRIATSKDAFGESPWRDIAGYGLLGVAKGAAIAVQPTPIPAPEQETAGRRLLKTERYCPVCTSTWTETR